MMNPISLPQEAYDKLLRKQVIPKQWPSGKKISFRIGYELICLAEDIVAKDISIKLSEYELVKKAFTCLDNRITFPLSLRYGNLKKKSVENETGFVIQK